VPTHVLGEYDAAPFGRKPLLQHVHKTEEHETQLDDGADGVVLVAGADVAQQHVRAGDLAEGRAGRVAVAGQQVGVVDEGARCFVHGAGRAARGRGGSRGGLRRDYRLRAVIDDKHPSMIDGTVLVLCGLKSW
jgi:hypothetical protein